MKIIPKFQKGGSYSSLFAVYTPVSVQQPQRVSRTSQATDTGSTKSDSQKGQLTEKDLFDMLKDIDGLPNDMQQITSNLLSTFELSNLTGLDSSSLATKYLSSLYKIKQAKFNKDEYEKAYNRAVANESLNDVAITLQGSIIVQDRESNGELKFISPEEYTDNKSKGQYIPVTNSNLLWLRANSPEYVNDFSLLQTIENGIGLNKVNEMIKERLQKLGTSEVSNETFYKKGSAVKGAELLDQMIQLGPEGYYKIKQSLTQTQKSQINAALEYIYSTLPANAKTRLRLETADGSHDQALKLINDYLFQGVSSEQTTDISYVGSEASLNKDKEATELKQNGPIKLLRGLGVKNTITINSGTGYSIQVLANTMPLTDENKKYLGANSTLLQASRGEYGSILQTDNVSMGMKKIDSSNFDKIVLTDGKISSIDFPYVVTDDGTVMPDLSPDTYRKKLQADREIKSKGINLQDQSSISANYQVINQIYTKYGLKPAYNEDGTLADNWTRFGVINAEASNRSLGMGQFDSNSLLQEINDDSVVNNLLKITKEEDFDKNEFYDFNGVDHFYKGTVWIPLDVSYIAATANQDISTSVVNDINLKEQQMAAQKSFTKEKK